MPKANKTRKFALAKRLLSPYDPRLKANVEKAKKQAEAKEKEKTQEVHQTPTAMFFKYNTALGPPYRVLVDTNFINFSIKNKLEMYKSMMDCLLAKCTPCISDCVMAELEKLGSKYTLALRLAKDPRFERLPCSHKGTYADDCIVERVQQIPGVPIMYVSNRKYTIERMPEAFGDSGRRHALRGTMKFMDCEKLGRITQQLTLQEVGDQMLHGKVECYTCKPCAGDKRLRRELETNFREEIELCRRDPSVSFSGSGSSPLGDFSDSSTRKLLINLISTMNASFPDYDFSCIRPEQFVKEPLRVVMNDVNRSLSELCVTKHPTLLEGLWNALADIIKLSECEVFSYLPDMESDPFSEGNIWSFNCFFVNKQLKRIVYLTCMAKSKFHARDGGMDESDGSVMDEQTEEEQYWVDDL